MPRGSDARPGRLSSALSHIPVLRLLPRLAAPDSALGPALACTLAPVVACTVGAMALDRACDTDSWFLLASGRYIIQSGIPHVNPWSVDPGLGIVIQQWLHDVWLYAAWALGGFPLASASLLVPFALWLASLARLLARARPQGHLPPYVMSLLLACACVLCSAWVTTRPTLWTMAAANVCLTQCLLWARTGRASHLVPLPLLVALHVNLHASMAWLDLGIVACFLLPAHACRPSRGRLVALLRRDRAPLVALVLMALAMLANPYGPDGALYLVRSYGAAGYRDLIAEMRSPIDVAFRTIASGGASGKLLGFLAWFLLAVAAPAAVLLRGRSRLSAPVPLVVVWAGFVLAGLSSMRSMWLAVVPSLTLLSIAWGRTWGREARAQALSRLVGRLPAPARSRLAMPASVLGALALALVVSGLGPTDLATRRTPTDDYAYSWAFMRDQAAPLARVIRDSGEAAPRVYAEVIVDNYLEWEGVPVMLDARPELWEPKISGDPLRRYRDYADTYAFGPTDANPTLDHEALRTYVETHDVGWVVLRANEAPPEGFTLAGRTDYLVLWRRDASVAQDGASDVALP